MRDDTLDTDYVEFGTPLEPYEDDAPIKLKPKNIEDQVVTDDQGRRRFHGAFTGGFSAGYFNSVGTSVYLGLLQEFCDQKMQLPKNRHESVLMSAIEKVLSLEFLH
ncbi:unnamed protein product [Darwinula stevensoni]|uniref:G patch domain-containing protein n=1 Tax=Darwinula stevensoni TaxID=69355 RepID=A0A7R9FRF7_9CRUS|nr:unnamed protein product [Darwinula stevensoni]CAG0900920.1 unnamed protein product [Darwinula stevensoni]